YVLLGIICGITAVSFNRSFYFIESLFDKVPWNPFGRLILGAIGLGIIGYLYPVVLGVGYHSITDLLNMRLAIHVVIILLIIKSIALLVSLGSGTSGGLLAPMFTMGAALGSLLALMLAHIWPEFAGYEGAMALAGMGALFAASSRSTFAFILFSFEITQNYSSILPLMITTTFASIIAWLFSKHSIMTERLAQRGLTLHHVYEVDIFRRITVGEAMTNHISLINQHTPIVELKHCLEPGEPAQAIVNDEGKLIGILTPANIAQGLLDPASVNKTCGELAKQVPITHPDEIIQDLLERTHKKNIDVYPVMSKTHPPKLLGWINRERMLEAKIQFEKTENEVEPAMLFRFNERP
ncbi:MAG: chloride channel protein, partial [Pseudomonadota bacterium]|nr:chloride channel protein [Pseudomonadota bacterium]